ncbi:MAG: radical SAM protein [Candidatus Falkowbacteria bacterium]
MKKNKLLIYLADVDHFLEGNRISIPLGIGSIKSYCKEIYGDNVDILLFKHPEKLMRAIKDSHPNILGLSLFMWNEKLALKVIECCKVVSPDTVTVVGGHNIARNTSRYKELLTNNPALDVVVLDQGEKSFSNIVYKLLHKDKKSFFSETTPGCAIRINNTNQIERGNIINDFTGLDKIPSPYLMGYFDDFLEAGYLPVIDTTRGCPHQCTYCGGGDRFFSKIMVRDEEVVYKELLYLLKKAKCRGIDLADTNFGMMGERDLRIISFIFDLNKKHNFPYIIGYATSKNKTEASIKVMKVMAKLTGELYLGLQTLTENVLNNCKRRNIPLNTMKELIDVSKKTNISVIVDLIFGLPEETVESFIKTISKLLSMGVKSPEIYQLRMLRGTEICENREKYNYLSKFRPINNRFGEYNLIHGKKPIRIIEAEEIACQNDTFSFDDYVTMRKLGFIITLLTGHGTFSNTVPYLISRKIDIMELVQFIKQEQKQYPVLDKMFKEYDQYSENELFESEEELVTNITENDKEWANLIAGKGNFFKINLGFIGFCLFGDTTLLDNIEQIIIKYAVKFSTEDIINLKEVLKHDKFNRLVQDKKEGKLKASDIKKEVYVKEKFDYYKWRSNGFKTNLEDYKYPRPITYIYYIRKYKEVIKTLQNLSHMSGFNFYERILTQAPEGSLERIHRKES